MKVYSKEGVIQVQALQSQLDVDKRKSPAAVTGNARSVEGAKETVEISTTAREVTRAISLLAEYEEERQANIERIKAQLKEGTYAVSSSDVAASMERYFRG